MGKESIKQKNRPSSDFHEGIPRIEEEVHVDPEPQQNYDDLEKQHNNSSKKLSAEYISEAPAEPQVPEAKPEGQVEKYPEVATHDSEEQVSLAVREGNRRTIVYILVPVLVLLLLAAGGIVLYVLKYSPWSKRDAMQSLEQALIGDSFLFDQTNADSTSMYTRQIKLDLQSRVKLADRPAEFVYQTYFTSFDYRLPADFIEAGNPQVTSYTAWYDQDYIKAMQFVFSNGQSDLSSPIFGNSEVTGLEMKQVALDAPVMSIESLIIGLFDPVASEHRWNMVNFKVNGLSDTQVGVDSPASELYENYEKTLIKGTINQNQRIMGVHGTHRSGFGGLRSLSFMLANQVHVLSNEEYASRINDEFKIKTQELNVDKSLISDLTVQDQLSLYGLIMQGYYGNNTTKEPALDDSQHLLWEAWTAKAGMAKFDAKVLFMHTIEGLW